MVVGIGLDEFGKRADEEDEGSGKDDPADILANFIKHIDPFIFITKDRDIVIYESEVGRNELFSSDKYIKQNRYLKGERETDCWIDYVDSMKQCTVKDIKEICKELINESRYSKI